MESDDLINSLAIRFLCGENLKLCRLCLASISQVKPISLDSSINVKTSCCPSPISVRSILNKLGVPFEPLLPEVLCNNCATIIINCYIFQNLVETSSKRWNTVIKALRETLSQPLTFNSKIRSACVMIGKTEKLIITSRQSCTTRTKLESVAKVNKIIQAKKNKPANDSEFICDECGKIFSERYFLTKHMGSHQKTQYQCSNCPKAFRLLTYLEAHAERVHYSKNLLCTECPKKFSTKRVLRHHLVTEHIPTNCDECKVEFPSKKALRYHLAHHKLNTCPHCNKQYSNIQYFKLHKNHCGKVGNPDKHICDICGKVYQAKTGLRSHMRTEHGFGDVMSCKWCDKKFDAVSRLNDHIVKHTKEKKFHCDKCGGRFVTQKSLTNHIRLHTGEKPYPCGICDESFLSASRRLAHRNRKHFEPAHKCSLCTAKFVSSFERKKHLKRHFNPGSKLYLID